MLIVSALVLLLVLPAVFGISQDEATDIVRWQVIQTSENKDSLRAYRWIAPVLLAKEAYNEQFKFDEPVWFFWIDDRPEAQFSHPNRYVFVYDDKYVEVIGANWYPENLEQAELFYDGKPSFFTRMINFIRGLI